MRTRILTQALAVAIVLAFSPRSHATVLKLKADGIVTSVVTEGAVALDGSVYPGCAMQGFCLYDTAAPDRSPYENFGDYPIVTISMTVANYTFTNDPDPIDSGFRVTVLNPGVDYVVESALPRFDGTVFVNGEPKGYDDLTWGLYGFVPWNLILAAVGSSTIRATDELPEVMPDISAFDMFRDFGAALSCTGPEYTGAFAISGNLTSIQIVPEPGTIVLFGLGAAILALRRID